MFLNGIDHLTIICVITAGKGHEKRRTVYNLYHILNHQVLFGGSYMSDARSMIEEILRS
jgi:fructosamine-3-kinase